MSRAAFAVVAVLALRGAALSAPAATSCTICHVKPEIAAIVGEGSAAIVEHEQTGAHAAAGLSCHDCHGGNPDPALADDLGAMDQHAAIPYVGAPKRADVPAFCGRCHSDPLVMKRFRPGAAGCASCHSPPSPAAKLGTSVTFAQCATCHGNHGIVRATMAMLGPSPPRRPGPSGCSSPRGGAGWSFAR